MLNVRIRKFNSGDQDKVGDLILKGLRDHFDCLDENLNPDLIDIENSYINSGHDFYVGTVNDNIVATAGLLHESPARFRVVRMSVAKGNRRLGIANRLMDHLVQRAVELNVEEVVATTEHNWIDATGLYLNYGFEVFGSDEDDVHLIFKIKR